MVFGADSTSTYTLPGTPPSYKFYNTAQKVFQIGEEGRARFGLCIWGDGMLGAFTHRAVVAWLAEKATDRTTVEEITQDLVAIMNKPEAQVGRSVGGVGYAIGGIDGVSKKPSCNRVVAMAGGMPQVIPVPMDSAVFVGAPRFFLRAHNGFDPDLPSLLTKHLGPLLPSVPDNFVGLVDHAVKAAGAELPQYVLQGIPLREAIDFVNMYLHLTVKAHKFMAGPPICGGAIELGFVTVDRPFRWVRHKSFDSGIDGIL